MLEKDKFHSKMIRKGQTKPTGLDFVVSLTSNLNYVTFLKTLNMVKLLLIKITLQA